MMASGEIHLLPTMARQMPVLAQSQYPALNDPNYFGVQSQPADYADSLSTPGLDLPPPNLATVNLPTFTGLSGASAAFVYGTLGGAVIGTGVGTAVGMYLGPAEADEFMAAAEVAVGAARTSPLWAPLVGIDTVSGLGSLGALAGMSFGGVITLGGYGIFQMTQVPLPASGQGYGYSNGNFSPF